LTDYFRKSGREIQINEDLELTDENIFIEEKELELDQEIDFEIVKKELETLPDFQRECLILKFVDDLSYDEISNITNKKQNTIRKTISRAIKKIKENLSEDLR
jgi:RNA polymerase sigma-70 factor (ECF subfamily)